MSELKVNFPPEERPSTSVSVMMTTVIALVLTFGILFAVYQMPTKAFTRDLLLGQKPVHKEGMTKEQEAEAKLHPPKESWVSKLNMNVERTIFQGLTLLMWAMSAACIGLKFAKIGKDMRLLRRELVPEGLNMRNMPSLIDLHAKLMANKAMGKSLAVTRVGRVLSMWINTEDFERTAQYAKQENEMDIYVSDSSFRANRLYIWAMPLLGFVGTVYGVSYGIGGFADFLRGQVTSEEIKYQVGLITEGLAVAFYCTLLGLMTAGIAAFPSLAAEKKEEELLSEIDALVEDRLVSRMPSVRKTEFPKEDIQAMREGIERFNVDISSEDLVDAIKQIRIEFPMEEFKAALSNIKLNLPMEDFVKGIKDGMQDLRLNVIMPMEELSRAIDQGFRRLPDPDKYVTVFSRAISEASDLVANKYKEFASTYEHRIAELSAGFAGKMDTVASTIQTGNQQTSANIAQQCNLVSTQFEQAVRNMGSVSDQFSQRVNDSTKMLAEQLKRVSDIAAQIDNMLNASKAMETAFAKVNTTEEFGRTLSAIREHLTTNDAFVQRMTKPRQIVLREETISS